MGGLQRIAKAGAKASMPSGSFRAYHGSPHDFDRFDASKIGTGEGNQTYGHGLYFAEREDVADAYRRKLAGAPEPMDLTVDGVPVYAKAWDSLPHLHKAGANYLFSRLRNYSPDYAPQALDEIRGDLPRLIDHADEQIRNFTAQSPGEHPWSAEHLSEQYRGAQDLLATRKVSVIPPFRPGRAYEVEIAYPQDAFLDWDASLPDQPAGVADALRDIYSQAGHADVQGFLQSAQHTGRDAYESVGNVLSGGSGKKVASPLAAAGLARAGVPGVRYWDQGSRGVAAGTHNYVMFPGTEDSIRILRKYSLLAPLVGGAAASGPQEQQPAFLDNLRGK